MGNPWQDLKKNFPWKDFTLGLLVPKAIFLIGIGHNKLFAGGLIAILWCIAVFWITRVRERKANIFAVLALAMIMIRIIVVVASKSPSLYMMAQSLDSALYGILFLLSLFLPRSGIQLLAEEAGIEIPRVFRESPYYRGGWRIITAVWGAVYMLFALILIMLKNLKSLKLAAIIDIFSGWPILIILIIFTMQFPKWYLARKVAKNSNR